MSDSASLVRASRRRSCAVLTIWPVVRTRARCSVAVERVALSVARRRAIADALTLVGGRRRLHDVGPRVGSGLALPDRDRGRLVRCLCRLVVRHDRTRLRHGRVSEPATRPASPRSLTRPDPSCRGALFRCCRFETTRGVIHAAKLRRTQGGRARRTSTLRRARRAAKSPAAGRSSMWPRC